MKLTTDFWNNEFFEFYELFYINGNTQEIIFKADLNDKFATSQFFKRIARHAQKEKLIKTQDQTPYGPRDTYFQFAITHQETITPIVWFNLLVNNHLVLSHDKAFDTSLVKRNGIEIPFGKFPIVYRKKLPLHREFNIKSRAMKFFANEVLK